MTIKVEREPMWDGNEEDSERFVKELFVEREPMWDGNY